jgi:hypothetical protein
MASTMDAATMNATADRSFFLIGDNKVCGSDPHLQETLARAYTASIRPLCLCVPDGVEMYIAKYGLYVLKRMPGTGKDHAAVCESYEPEPSLSGLGFHLGETVVIKGPELLEVRSAFALDRFEGRAIERGEPAEATSVSTKRRALSMLGLFHLLWDTAQFNRWSPAMQDRRNQNVIRRYTLEAAEKIALKGMRLSERLFVPEQFKSEDAEAIRSRRQKAFSVMSHDAEASKHKLMFIVGEIKSLKEITLGYKLIIKHMPDCPFWLDAKLGKRVLSQYGSLFNLRDMQQDVKLMGVFTMAMKGVDDFRVDTMTIAMTTQTWIPIEDAAEKVLADALTAAGRRFIKPLSFDAPSAVAFPNFLLLDAGRDPVPLNIVPITANHAARKAKEALMASATASGWAWRPEVSMTPPALPAKQPMG